MAYLLQIQNQLRERLTELCEACYAEQELLEEGGHFDSDESTFSPPNHTEGVGTADVKSADAA